MKRILHIAPTPFFADRGCHIRIEGIVRCLEQLGYENTVCTYHHGREVESVITKRIAPIKNYTKTAAGPSKYKLWADWKLLWLVIKETKRTKPSVIHAHLHEGLLIGIIVKVLFFWRNTPLIADMQGSLTGELESHGAFRTFKALKHLTHLLERLLMWCPTAIVCSSPHSLEKISVEFNIPRKKISLAQDGANQVMPLSIKQRSDMRTELGLTNDQIVVAYSGALLESKGLAELKQLIKQTSNGGIHFLIIGYPVENLEPFLNKEGLSHFCTLTGQVEFARLPSLLSCCDIAVDPKNSDAGEGSGKMLNYLACGLPVVAFDTANNRQFLPGSTTLAGDVESLAKNLHELAKNQSSRKEIAQLSLRHFKQHHCWEITVGQLQAVYQNL